MVLVIVAAFGVAITFHNLVGVP